MTVALIWAQARDAVIGAGGFMPWHLPEDLAHFRALTGADPVVMGRRTWESLPERYRPLPGRRNIVVTRRRDAALPGATIAHSLTEALAVAGTNGTTWVIGGGELYREALPLADLVELTELDLHVAGDTFAPAIGQEWVIQPGPWLTAADGTRYRFVRCVR